MRVLIAPDKFKGSLSALEAARALESGLRSRYPEHEFELKICPIADGGEGFTAGLITALRGTKIEAACHDPLGRQVSGSYGLCPQQDGSTLAVIEMAEASGLWRLQPDERDPLQASTLGTGELMLHAAQVSKADALLIGLGGSATNDAGCGMAAALGARFFGPSGQRLEPRPQDLANLERIDLSGMAQLPPVTAACDVENPLLGPEGATAVYGPQKGVTPESAPLLEQALSRVASQLGAAHHAITPGAGAAGGLGFGLLAFCSASLLGGFDLYAQAVNLPHLVAWADLILTGEGSLDEQSLSGKGPVALARLAGEVHTPVCAFAGSIHPAVRASGHFVHCGALADSGLPVEELMTNADSYLHDLVARADLKAFFAS